MLVIVGELDGARPAADRLHKLVPGSQYHVVKGAPHNVYYEAAAEYNQVLGAFLDRVLSRATAGATGD